MCGIIGGMSSTAIKSLLLQGLNRLEYRGYDSFGLMTSKSDKICVEKKVGAPSQFSAQDFSNQHTGTIGLAHTRWVTHGIISETNAHPHYMKYRDNELCIVHNGIVENLKGLKENLDSDIAELLRSDTDTEVIIAVMMQALKSGLEPLEAFNFTCNKIKGQFALIIFSQNSKDKYIFAQRSTLPLYFQASKKNQTSLLCSDLEGFNDKESPCYSLNQRQTFILGHSTLKDLTPIAVEDHKNFNVKLDRQFSTMMEKEIFEQPSIIKEHLHSGNFLPEQLKEHKWTQIHIVGCGSSYHAGLVGNYWFEQICKTPTKTFIASEYKYNPPVTDKESSLVIVLSQSGETADLLALIGSMKENYKYIVSICNNTNSTLVSQADFNIELRAGKEIGVASTKAFTAQVLCLLKAVCALNNQKDWEQVTNQKKALNLNEHIEETLTLSHWDKLAKWLSSYRHLMILGRGPLLAIAQEGALKIKEIAYIHAQALPTGELKHGSLALVDETCPVIINLNTDHFLEKNLLACQELLARKAKLIVIADEKCPIAFEDKLEFLIRVPVVEPLYQPILFTLPMQLIALKLAQILGHNVDKPRNLAKSVTVE